MEMEMGMGGGKKKAARNFHKHNGSMMTPPPTIQIEIAQGFRDPGERTHVTGSSTGRKTLQK